MKQLFDWVKAGHVTESVVMMIDFKMKVEPERHWETQLKYYGNAGMSWHGAGIFYKPDRRRDVSYMNRM